MLSLHLAIFSPRPYNYLRQYAFDGLASAECLIDQTVAPCVGTGQVQRIIAKATFQPQAAAFTALLHMCAKAKLWEKALEIFEAMKAHHPSVINTVHFSSLISACATAGRWEEAYRVCDPTSSLVKMPGAYLTIL